MVGKVFPSAMLWGCVSAAGIVAACGGGLGNRQSPSELPGPSEERSPDASVPGPDAQDVGNREMGAADSSEVGALGLTRPITATRMGAELRAIQLELNDLPPLAKLEGDKLRKVMRLFTKSLGAKCGDCHADDFAAPTPMKKVAERMWNEFVRGLAREDETRIFCDSCHQGHLTFLDRHDKRALSKWMNVNFVSKLRRLDHEESSCDKCHGDPFEPKFLSDWAGRPLHP